MWRNRKSSREKFKCPCGHVDHADVNASFNIGQSVIDRDITEGSTDTPKGDILIKSAPDSPLIYRGEYVRFLTNITIYIF